MRCTRPAAATLGAQVGALAQNEPMPSLRHDLSSLLHPIPSDTFFAQYWERKPLLVRRGNSAYYQDLLTNRHVEDFISSSDARYPAILLANQLTNNLLHEALGMHVFTALTKPVDFNVLLDSLARVLRRYHESRWPTNEG